MRISDWSSDVCSSDLFTQLVRRGVQAIVKALFVFIVITLDHEVISPGIIPPPLESQIVLVGNPLNLAHVIKVAAMAAVMLIPILIPAGGAAVRFQCGKLCDAVAQPRDALSRTHATRTLISLRYSNTLATDDVFLYCI